jgi:hypothetical protein
MLRLKFDQWLIPGKTKASVTRQMTAFLLGSWLTGSVAMALVATQNFRTVDRVLKGTATNAELNQKTEGWTSGDARMVLRHLASEMNRLYFRAWEWTQLLFGAVLILLLSFGQSRDLMSRHLVIAMVIIILVFVVYLTPNIVTLGRSLDFTPRDPPPPEYARFWRFHIAYTTLDLLKLGLGLWTTIRLLKS